MNPADRLYEKAKPIWDKSFEHPFVQEIGNGTLAKDKFRFFMIQDYLYLIEYARLFALGVLKARDLKVMGQFGKLLDGTLNTEMELHRQYARQFDISREDLEQAEPAATTLAYTHYMLQVSQNGTLAELMASLVPCSWGYYDIGKRLNDIPGAAEHEFYGEWVKLYGGQEFKELAEWTIELLNDAARDKPEGELQRLEEIFLTTSRFEYMFWEMAYKKEMWLLDER